MSRDELLKDWYIRYHLILGRRYTGKQKKSFLQSVFTDINQFRKDIEIDSFKLGEQNKQEYRNLYIGDVKTADKVICTYYDTPAIQLDSYHFFNLAHRKRVTMKWIGIFSLLFILLGVAYTLFIGIPTFQAEGLWSIPSVLSILFYIVYFYLLNKITRGWPRKKNLIRNTSSILLILNLIYSFKNKKIAYAFLDAGCTNNAGLDQLQEQTNAAIYMVDSIGSSQPLYQVAKDPKLFVKEDSVKQVQSPAQEKRQILYLISAKEDQDSFVLSRENIRENQLNDVNMNIAYDFLEKVIGRNF
ncbi:hypothetical protein LZ578_04140 [Jeotgalibaca sp. MA1X17-3]|uniref:hypothetical protein n=1 Tax=Jeotgalibaca sp. MA1X17-3 TaxID=2908211 RepID=UPI001F2EC36E|nr:hypothetical protein [Jeotgalibaca sp. MA1X17-3]UJF16326.1 hypothetical protein LZ578_04140 [Jeotgalibaca sp. MA1X17-3]